jgi:thiol-disulfide isomerase/thioredoxin
MLSRRVPRPVLAGVTLLVLLAVAVVVMRGGDDDTGPSVAQVRAVELAALGDGDAANLGDLLDGKPLVLNFFAVWCQPCRQEMPDFERVSQDLGDSVGVIGVAVPPSTQQSQEIVDETGVTYPTYADPTGEVLALFEGTQMPTTVFITADGEVTGVENERLTRDEILRHVADDLGVDP